MNFFFFQAEDGIRDYKVTGVQTCALPISQASAILLLAELPAMGVCALLAMEISKNRGKWAVQFQFIKDSSSLMIFCAIIPVVALSVFMLFYEISEADRKSVV